MHGLLGILYIKVVLAPVSSNQMRVHRAAKHMVDYNHVLYIVQVTEQLYILNHELSIQDELKT